MEKNGRLTGYSIELWERVVREARIPFDPDQGYKIVENVQQMLEALRNGQAERQSQPSALPPNGRRRSTSVIPSRNRACKF